MATAGVGGKVMLAVTNGQPEGRVFYGKPLVFREKAHRYYWGGEPIPSVTTILGRIAKPALIQWAANMAVDHILTNAQDHREFAKVCEEARKAHAVKKDTAADLGTQIHSYAQDCLRARHLLLMPDDPKLKPACEGFGEWFTTHTIHAIEVERMVLSEKCKYAGRCDFFGRIDGKLGVMEIKTSGGVYDEFWLQLSAYEIALVEELQLAEPLTRWILHLNKETGAHKLHERAMSTPTITAWMALVRFDQMMRIVSKAA